MSRRLSVALLTLAALALAFPPAAAGGACHAGTTGQMTTSNDGEVAIAGCAFTDTVTYVDPGDTVTWTSKDTLPHTVTGAARAWGDEEVLDAGDAVSYTFEDEGVYPYFCGLHPAMVGAVVVGDGKGAAGSRGIEKVDLAAAARPAETPPSGGSSVLALATSALAGVLALAVVLRLALRRRAAAARPA